MSKELFQQFNKLVPNSTLGQNNLGTALYKLERYDEALEVLEFAEKYELKYNLGSDESNACEKLGIWIEKSMYGKKYFGINRSTYIIGNRGDILKTWHNVKVNGHVSEVLKEIEKLK